MAASATEASAGPARFHWLRLRATAHPTEDVEWVAEALRTLAGDAALPVEVAPVESHHGGTLHLLQAQLTRNADIRRVLDACGVAAAGLDPETRVDEDGVLWLRADKQAAADGHIRLADVEDAIRILVRLEVHPARREVVVAAWRAWLDMATGRAGGPV